MRCPAGANRQGGAGESTFDLRFAKFPRLRAILAEQMRTECRETMRGRGYKGAGIFAKQVRTRVDEAVRGVWRLTVAIYNAL